MSLQLANYKDLEQIVKIEKDTNEHPWSLNNFKSSPQIFPTNGLVLVVDPDSRQKYKSFSLLIFG